MIFKGFNAFPQRPTKYGALGELKCQVTLLLDKKSRTLLFFSIFSISLYNLFNSFFAPMNVVALSNDIEFTIPRRARKRLKQAMKASVDRSLTNSKCTALVAKQTTTAT